MQFWRAVVAMIYLEEHYGSELQHHKVLFNILKFHYVFSKFLTTHIPLKKNNTKTCDLLCHKGEVDFVARGSLVQYVQ